MEAIIEAPVGLPDFSGIMDAIVSTASKIKQNFTAGNRAYVLRKPLRNYIQALDNLFHYIPDIMVQLGSRPSSEAEIQSNLTLDFYIRTVYTLVSEMYELARSKKFFKESDFKKLKSYFHELPDIVQYAETVIFDSLDLPKLAPTLKYSIGEIPLRVPLRIFIEDDDTGKHVSCLELPMLYGFGETLEEAMSMLDREILALRDELKCPDDFPPEYRYAANLINAALSNAK